MITVVVKFKISDTLTSKILKEKFIETSTMYQKVDGLLRKNYIADIENKYAGGVYTFVSMKSAKNWFNEDRIEWITQRFSKPEVAYYESPVIVDNEKNLLSNLKSIAMPLMSKEAITDLSESRPRINSAPLDPANWKANV